MNITGCSALGVLGRAIGGGSGTSGHTISPKTNIGDNKTQTLSTHITAANAQGSVSGGDTSNVDATHAGTVSVNQKRTWLSELQQNATILLLVGLCFSVLLILVAWLTRAPGDSRKIRTLDIKNQETNQIIREALLDKLGRK